MKNFKKLIKEAYLGNPLNENSINENLMAKFQDALDDDQFAFFQRALDKADRGEELNQSEEQVVKYFGMVKAKYDDAIAQGMSPDEITLNPNKSIDEVIGIGRPTYRDKKNKIARDRSTNKTANYHDLLKYYQYAIAKIPRHKREKANNAQAMHDRYGQEVWDILKKSYPEANLSEIPPQSWTDTAGELIQTFTQDYKKSIYQPFYDMYKPEDLKDFMNEAEARVNEIDSLNDPVLAKVRRRQMQDDAEKAKQAALDKKYGSSFMDKLDAELDLKAELEDLNQEREMIMIDMEEEAEPEGGPIADRYGERLNQIDQRIADIQEELDDLRMYESVNEDRFEKNEDSYVKVSQPRFVFDNNFGNFLFVRMDYDTGPGVSIALGKETMAGQIRRLSSQEAMRRAEEIARNLEQMFDVEDIDIVDKENGTVEIFAVSDDFENMDPKSKFSWNGYKYGLKSLNEGLLNEELLKEFTYYGGDYRESYANRLPEEQLTSTDDYELFMEMFPQGEASRILMDPKRKELYDKHLEWTKEYDNNNTFVHMQYHEVEHEGELYKVHQTQYYNGNYDDFRNPRFTELMISKDGKRMGTYLVDTTEYIKDLKNLDVKKRVSESLNEQRDIYDDIANEEFGMDYDQLGSNEQEWVRDEIDNMEMREGTCGYTPNGKPRSKPAGPDLNEDEIPSYLTKNIIFGKAVEDSVSFNDFQKRVYGILGPKYYKLTDQGSLKDFYDSVRVTKPNLEEESDTDVGGSAKPPIGLDIDDAHSGDAALNNAVKNMGYNESKGFDFKKMVKEALTPKNLR